MKLHIHRAYHDGQRFHAYTRDKAGKLLKNYIQFGDDDSKTVFSPGDWTYFRPTVFDDNDLMPHEQRLKDSIQVTGLAIAHLKKFPGTIYVFDAQYDHTDARIYSLDEKLREFLDFQNSVTMKPKGELLGCDEIEKVGEISEKYYFEIEDLGIDLRQLTRQGFSVVFTHSVNGPEEYLRRRIQRAMREKFPKRVEKKLGIQIHDISVSEFSISKAVEKGSSEVTDRPPVNMVDAENATPATVAKNDRVSVSRLVKLFFILVASVIGFAASAVAVMEFMEIGRDDVIEFFDSKAK